MNPPQTKLLVLKSFIFSLFLSLFFILLYLSFQSSYPHITTTTSTAVKPILATTTTTSTAVKPIFATSTLTGDLRIRPGYTTYETYIKRQLAKTQNPKLRKIWTTRDWDRKLDVFAKFFADLKSKSLLMNDSKALCIGARVGQEVAALKRVGVTESIGIDLVPYPPLVIKGDFHHQPFDNETFDFEFSNVFDHALYPLKFVGEIERTLKPGGVCVLHVALSRRSDKYSANDLYSVGPLKEMFSESDVVHVRKVDGFGLDTEVVFQKKKMKMNQRF